MILRAILYAFFSIFLSVINCTAELSDESITPYKFKDPSELAPSTYKIPKQSIHTIQRSEISAPSITYYVSTPTAKKYPIALIFGGSSSYQNVSSSIHIHRYLLQEFIDLQCGVLSIEQWGIDSTTINKPDFFYHYTRSQRLADARTVINHLIHNPPPDWNGLFIFLGISEGGPIVTQLAQDFNAHTLATINWCGAGDWKWNNELWTFIKFFRKNNYWLFLLLDACGGWMPFVPDIPKTRKKFDSIMQKIETNPSYNKWFMGMTYAYHYDAQHFPCIEYTKITQPFLVVSGGQDPNIESCNSFVSKALTAKVPLTYFYVPEMDHYIRHRPDIIKKSFDWLEQVLVTNNNF